MWNASASCGSGSNPIASRRSGTVAIPVFHGGGLVCRPLTVAHFTVAALEPPINQSRRRSAADACVVGFRVGAWTRFAGAWTRRGGVGVRLFLFAKAGK